MDHSKKKNSLVYFYPLIIFIFFVNFHFYDFYQKNFLSMLKIISKRKEKTLYEKIQSQNHYYEVWRLANLKKNVIFVNEDKSSQFIDYVSTYFLNKNKPQDKKITYYLTELNLMTKYFFYPKIVPVYSFYQIIFSPPLIKKGIYIISDYEFESFYKNKFSENKCLCEKSIEKINIEKNFLSFYQRLKRIEISNKDYVSVIRRPEKTYYLYEVIK